MRTNKYTFLIAFLFISSFLQAQIVEQVKVDSIYSTFDNFPINTQFSIAFVENDSTVFMGFKKTADGKIEIDNKDSIFEIGSLTKVFTTTLLGQKVWSKEVDLLDKISKYIKLPEGGNVANIKLIELANHTSGLARLPLNLNILANYNNPYKSYTRSDLMEFLGSSHPSLDSLSKEYAYSNLGMGLLADILVQIDSTNFEGTLQKNIFEPYEMNSTASNRTYLNSDRIVVGLNVDGTQAQGWDFGVLAGAGAILSTSSDISKFMKYQLLEDNPSSSIVMSPTYRVHDSMQIGLGWHILQRDERKYYWHNGGTGGYTSSLILDRENKKGVVILTNISAFHPNAKEIDQLILFLVD